MRHTPSTLVLFFAAALLAVASAANSGDACSADYQCNIPYGTCSSPSSQSSSSSAASSSASSSSASSSSSESHGTAAGSECTLIPGFGLDDTQDKLYFAARCAGIPYLFSANADGTDITELHQIQEDTNATSPGYDMILEFYALSPTDFYIERSIRAEIQFDTIDRETYNDSATSYQFSHPPPTFSFDLQFGQTYGCRDFDVASYNSLLTGPQYSAPFTTIYTYAQLQNASSQFYTCQATAFVGTTLYILVGPGAVNESYVLQGSTDGSAPLKKLFPIYTSDSFPISTIAADNQAIYYATQYSIDRYFINGATGPTQLYPDHNPHPKFTHIASDAAYVYFDDGSYIRRVNKDTLNTEELIAENFTYSGQSSSSSSTRSTRSVDSASSDTVCTCRPNFYGNDCTQCDGQVQWNNGVPSCVELLGSGFPSSCSADYQCGNPPYTECNNGKCQCASTFSGRQCTLCSGSVSFNNGKPTCSDASAHSSSAESSSAHSSSSAESSSGHSESGSSSASCDVSVTQNLRTQWQAGTKTYYLYDVTLTNQGQTTVSSPTFFIRPTDNQSAFALSQTWNLVVYASTVADQQIVSLQPNTRIAPGASYTGAGYVVEASHTQLQLSQCA